MERLGAHGRSCYHVEHGKLHPLPETFQSLFLVNTLRIHCLLNTKTQRSTFTVLAEIIVHGRLSAQVNIPWTRKGTPRGHQTARGGREHRIKWKGGGRC